MSKELEALKRMEYFVNEEMGIKTFNQSGWHIEGTDDYQLVKEGLERLEAIDNANPSEALMFIQELLNISEMEKHFINLANYETRLNLVKTKQALIKKQEQEKVLNILKSKKYIPLDRLNPRFWNDKETYDETVNYEFYLWLCEDECEYVVKEERKLTKNEFNSIKEMLKNEITR